MSIQIDITFPNSIEFAFERTTFPLFDTTDIVNDCAESLKDLVLEISCDPACFVPKRLPVPNLKERSTLGIGDITVELSADFFSNYPTGWMRNFI